jgi:hypothetical protein
MTPTAEPAHARACDNCHAVLQGGFCHQCGQNAHNPLRSFGHAVEEVFESFWHLDGRIFRTLRTLMSPGKLAIAYLGGHRAPYVAPLRLFVILSVLTFFVGKFAVSSGDVSRPPEVPDGKGGTTVKVTDAGDEGVDFSTLTDPDEVVRLRDQTIDGLLAARATLPPPLAFAREQVENNIRGTQARARARIAALQPDHPALAEPDRIPEDGPMPDTTGSLFSQNGKPWHQTDNPVRVDWLPAFGNRWLNKKIARAQDNIPRLQKDPELFKNTLMGAVPSALFVLVPVFALLLKLAYIGSRRVYLEHLVVALYSHAYLCLCVLAFFVLSFIDGLLPAQSTLARAPIWLTELLILFWMPVYLFWMQQRVYRQHPAITLVKYLALGMLYFMLVVTAMVLLSLTSLVNA